MSEVSTILQLSSFAAGELSPRLNGRSDIRQYAQGCRTLLNFVVQKHGGATKRPGTRFVAAAKDASTPSRMVPFQYNDDVGYALEFADQFVRFHRFEAGVPTQLNDVGPTPTQIASPWLAAHLARLKFAQSADTLIVTHTSYAPRKLLRSGTPDTASASWTIAALGYEDGPYESINLSATTIAPAATTGATTLTASAPLFASTDVGRWVRILHGSTWGAAIITGFTSTTVVNATVLARLPFGATAASANWRLGAWHDGTTGGTHWPKVACFHQGRLYLGGSQAFPQRLWASEVDDFDSFSPSSAAGVVGDSNALDITIDDDRVNAIRWLVSDKTGLLILTSGGEFVLASANDAPITPSAGRIRRHGSRGALNAAPPAKVGSSIVFFESARKLRQLGFEVTRDRLDGPDLAILSEHVTKPGVVDSAYLETPESVLWVVLEDGTLASVTLEPEQEVVGWARHVLGSDEAYTAIVESVCAVREDGMDRLWLTCQRKVGSSIVRHVECMELAFDHDQAQEDAWHLDDAKLYDSTPTTTITGLAHLEGRTVRVLADGTTHPDVVVSSGSITLEQEASKVLVGMPVESRLRTMPLVPPAPWNAHGSLKGIDRVVMEIWNTVGGEFVDLDGRRRPIPWRHVIDESGLAPPLVTGPKQLDTPLGMQLPLVGFDFAHDDPQPCTILALAVSMRVGR